jgi:hypothetical protein
MPSMVRQWSDWIETSALSQWIQSEEWVVPASQSIHILALSVVFGSAVLINLRLLGVGSAHGRSVPRLLEALLPWTYRGLLILLLTGAVQTIAEPMRQFGTPAFWLKMLMIPIVFGLTRAFARMVRQNPARWDSAAAHPTGSKLFALVCLGLWVAIICCGRFIGYSHV